MSRIIMIFLLLIIISSGTFGADGYKKYKVSSDEENLLKISFANSQTIITVFDQQDESNNESFVFDQETRISFNFDTVSVQGKSFLTSKGFFTPDGFLPAEEVGKIEIETDKKGKLEIFLTRKGKKVSKFVRSRSKNRFGLGEIITVNQDEFIRGSAISFWSNMEINGEVNGNVVAIFGDVMIGDRAIIRGDVFALNGNVNLSKNSTVYGEIRSSNIKDKHRYTKTWRVNLNFRNLTSLSCFSYNRVDGAAPYFGYKYLNGDSSLPEISAKIGYGFASERWRYEFGLKQYVFKNRFLRIGGIVYKRLASHDNRIISERENTLFALLATEDYKDYLEAEGGRVAVEFNLPLDIDLEFSRQTEKYRWLETHKNLWSLAGGSKRFRDNFSSVDSTIRSGEKSDIDGKELSTVGFKLRYNKNGKDNYPYNSFTTANLAIELTPSKGNDFFDYRRYLLTATRFQVLDRRNSLIFRAEYGKLDKDLIPLHKKFFIGGLGTLYGYEHKEYYGIEYWLGRAEYSIKFPASSWNTWLFYELGQIASYDVSLFGIFQSPSRPKLSEAEIKNSIGIGLSFTDIIRLNVAKRLDRSDDTMTLTVRMKHQF